MLITAGPEESGELLDRLDIKGEPQQLEEFISAFGVASSSNAYEEPVT